ncbi:tetratricopeptide repeat protein 1 [Brachionichthys hirsutus]|uniref:tetratricopeptide repeat protein 1 n=1 Tax=Brachionichthys hirsutus TaxID=412623 RepID=UPI003604B59F
MSCQGGEQRSSHMDGTTRAQEEEDEENMEENFFDCRETAEPPSQRGGGEDEGEEEAGKPPQDEGGSEDFHCRKYRLSEDRDIPSGEEEEEEEEEEGGNRLQGEAQGNWLQDDSELKEEKSPVMEFNDDYLREVEEALTEEEKESRRKESLSLKEKGNDQFKAGSWAEAEQSYREALVRCPVCFSRERAVLFSNRAAARLHQGSQDQAISDCTRAIELNPDYLRALLRRAELYEQTEKLDEALEDYKKVLERDPNQASARQACVRLPPQIQERNEKLKDEMLSKLKDLGNMVLRPFGLSTENFHVNQDANTGSYSVNFVQNPNNNS